MKTLWKRIFRASTRVSFPYFPKVALDSICVCACVCVCVCVSGWGCGCGGVGGGGGGGSRGVSRVTLDTF